MLCGLSPNSRRSLLGRDRFPPMFQFACSVKEVTGVTFPSRRTNTSQAGLASQRSLCFGGEWPS